VETSYGVTIAPAKPAARDAVPTLAPIDPQVRADSISAMVKLGFTKTQAIKRVDAVKGGTTTEEISTVHDCCSPSAFPASEVVSLLSLPEIYG